MQQRTMHKLKGGSRSRELDRLAQNLKIEFSPGLNKRQHFAGSSKSPVRGSSPSGFLDFNMNLDKNSRAKLLLLSFERTLNSSSWKSLNRAKAYVIPKIEHKEIREFDVKQEEEEPEIQKGFVYASPKKKRRTYKQLNKDLESTKPKKKKKQVYNFDKIPKIKFEEDANHNILPPKRDLLDTIQLSKFSGKKAFNSSEIKLQISKPHHSTSIIFDGDGGFDSCSEELKGRFSLGNLQIADVNKLELCFFSKVVKEKDSITNKRKGKGKRRTKQKSKLRPNKSEFLVNLKSIMQYTENEQIKMAKRQREKYICKYCGQIFSSGCALGGHVSKIHRGVSLNYKKKQMNRKEKKIERQRTKFINHLLRSKK